MPSNGQVFCIRSPPLYKTGHPLYYDICNSNIHLYLLTRCNGMLDFVFDKAADLLIFMRMWMIIREQFSDIIFHLFWIRQSVLMPVLYTLWPYFIFVFWLWTSFKQCFRNTENLLKVRNMQVRYRVSLDSATCQYNK